MKLYLFFVTFYDSYTLVIVTQPDPEFLFGPIEENIQKLCYLRSLGVACKLAPVYELKLGGN